MISMILTFDDKPADVQAVVDVVLEQLARSGLLYHEHEATVMEYTGSFEIAITIAASVAGGVLAGALGLYGQKIAEWTISTSRALMSKTNESEPTVPARREKITEQTVIASVIDEDYRTGIHPIMQTINGFQKSIDMLGMDSPKVRVLIFDEENNRAMSVTHVEGEETIVRLELSTTPFGKGGTQDLKVLDLEAIEIELPEPDENS